MADKRWRGAARIFEMMGATDQQEANMSKLFSPVNMDYPSYDQIEPYAL
ncbi:hypothetical protein [Bradyrhizobium sp. AZCC 2230]